MRKTWGVCASTRCSRVSVESIDIFANLFDGIDDGNRQYCSAALVGLENHGFNFLNSNEGPHGIVNSDDRGIRAEVLHRDRNRILTASAALDDRNRL